MPDSRALLEALVAAAPTPVNALEVCRLYLEEAGARIVVDEAAGTLVARVGEAPALAFSGHLDVVPAGEGWESPPHEAVERDGAVWGRGTSDMLGAVAAFLPVAREGLPVAFLLTTDEETTMEGARILCEAGALEGIDAVVVGEPTDLEIGVAEKGVLWFEVVVEGRSAHASMPELGANAVAALCRGIAGLGEWRPPGAHPILGEATLSVGVVSGGDRPNVVPGRAHAAFDVRYLPGQDPHGIIDHVARVVAEEGGLPVTTSLLSDHAPFAAHEGSRLVEACRVAVAEAGHPVRAVPLPYGTEASKYQALGVDLVVLGPGERAVIHTNRERILVADLEAGRRAYSALARAYAGGHA